jgi:membrane protein DedA with SNARE-associated domain
MAGMNAHRFLAVNIVSAMVWGPAHVLPAQFAGKTIMHLCTGAWREALWGGLGLVVLSTLAYLGTRWVKRRMARTANAPVVEGVG